MGATGRARRPRVLRPRRRRAAGDRPADARVPARRAARRALPRTPARLVRDGTADRYGEYATAVLDRMLAYAAGDGARGDRPARADRPRDAARLQLEARPVRADRDELDGVPRPAPVRAGVAGARLKARPRSRATTRPRCGTPATASPASSSTPRRTRCDDAVLEMIERTVADRRRADTAALVIYNEGPFFSTGGEPRAPADAGQRRRLGAPGRVRRARAERAFDGPQVRAGAGGRRRLRPRLGGGCEVLLHCDAVQAHTETYMGLVELGVGLLPAWGGCRELLMRAAAAAAGDGPMPPARHGVRGDRHRARLDVGPARAASSGYLRAARPHHPQPRPAAGRRQRAFALELADGYAPPEPRHDRGRGPLRAGNARADRAPARAARRRGQRLRPACWPARYARRADRRRRRPGRGRARGGDLALELDAVGGSSAAADDRAHRPTCSTTGKPLRN